MIDWTNTSWSGELENHWGWHSDKRSYCGCAEPPSGYFSSGHDLRVVYPLLTNLLAVLRGNPQAEEIVRQVAEHHLRQQQGHEWVSDSSLFAARIVYQSAAHGAS